MVSSTSFTPSSTLQLHVIGLGVAEIARISQDAERALLNAQYVIGSKRQLATVEVLLSKTESTPKQLELPPLNQLEAFIHSLGAGTDIGIEVNSIALLASGDPLYYGIGRWIKQHFTKEQLHFYPAISSIQATCHALGLALQEVKVVSLHGRPLLSLRRHLSQQRYLLLLTDQTSHPAAIAQLCIEAGFVDSKLWICERLGYTDENIREFIVKDLVKDPMDANNNALKVADLNTCVLELSSKGDYLHSHTGIDDVAFVTDREAGKGMLTKREVRVNILALIQPHYTDIAWDIGAGCGGVAIEWALAQASASIYAIEHHPERLSCLQQNQERFGVVRNLHIIDERAPACLKNLPTPTKIFIGGSDGELESLLVYCWQRLVDDGVLVVSTVTEMSKHHCLAFAETLPDSESSTETVQIAVSKGSKLAGQWVYRPNLPVSLFRFSKLAKS